MENKHEERWWISYITWECQINTWGTIIPVRIHEFQKVKTLCQHLLTKRWNRRISHSLLMRQQNSTATWEVVWQFYRKPNIVLLYDPAIALNIYPNELKLPHEDLCMDIYCNFIHNCKSWKEPSSSSVAGWTNKLWYI